MDKFSLGRCFDLVQFLGGDGLLLETIDLLEEFGLHCFGSDIGIAHGEEEEDARVGEFHVVAVDLVGELLLLYHRLVEAAAFAGAEDLGEDGEGDLVRMAVVGDIVRDGDSIGGVALFVDEGATAAVTGWLGGGDAQQRGARISFGRDDGTEMFLGSLKDLLGLNVTGDDDHSIVRAVKAAVEGANILDAPVLDIAHEADRRPVVAVGGVVFVEEAKIEVTDGVVVGAPATLFGDDVALFLELFVTQIEVGHQFGKQLQRLIEVSAGRFDVVVGVVKSGRSVVDPAVAFDDLVKLPFGQVFGRFEIHVLKHVGNAALAHRLVPASDIVEDVSGDDTGVIVHRDHHDAEAVGEGGFVVFWEGAHVFGSFGCAWGARILVYWYIGYWLLVLLVANIPIHQ